MKQISTLFLQSVIVLVGISALVFLLWEPHVEGRNAQATLFEMYFKDSFLAYAYVGSLSFFAALYQAFRVLAFIRRGEVLSQKTVKALRTIQYCALTTVGFVIGGEIFIVLSTSDDRAGGVVMGILIAFGSLSIAATAALFEQVLQNVVKTKSDRDSQSSE